MSYYVLCVEGDIIIDHGNSNFKDLDGGQKGLNLASTILTAALVVVFMVWSGYCSWLVVQLAQYPSALQSLGHLHYVSEVLPELTLDYETSAEHGWLHCGPPGAGHL